MHNIDGRIANHTTNQCFQWKEIEKIKLAAAQAAAGAEKEKDKDGDNGFGIGWLVEALDGDTIVGAREITVTQGYSAGVVPMAHFGLGGLGEVTLRLTPPGGADPVLVEEVAANQHIRWPDGC